MVQRTASAINHADMVTFFTAVSEVTTRMSG